MKNMDFEGGTLRETLGNWNKAKKGCLNRGIMRNLGVNFALGLVCQAPSLSAASQTNSWE